MTLLTEAEARQEICPLIRYCVNEADAVHHGKQPIYLHQICTGSDCKIGWRWQKDTDFLEVGEQPRGYCGAFGSPAQVLR